VLKLPPHMIHSDSFGAAGDRWHRGLPRRLYLILATTFIATTFIARLAAAQATPADITWVGHESKAGGFSISMPGAPVESKTAGSASSLRTVDVNLESKEGHFPSGERFSCTASVTFLPVSLESRETAQGRIDAFLKGYTAGHGAEKLRATNLQVQQLPARRTEWANSDGSFKQTMLSVFTGNREFTITFNSGLKNHAGFADRFFDSFRIDDPRYVNPGELIEFKDPVWNFSVKMPGFPERIEINGAKGKSVVLSNYAYFMTVGELLAVPADTSKFLEEKSAQMGTAYHGTIVSNAAVTGALARRLQIVGEKSKTEVLVGLKGARWYAMSVNTRIGGELDKNMVETFFGSLILN
jgi:hypothetical protein